MSRIDELIKELCPDGVEYRTLGELLEAIPRGRRLTRSDLPEVGSIPVFHGGLEPIGFTDNANTPAMTVMVINVGASAGSVGWSGVPFWCSDGCFALPHSALILSKYLYYCALANQRFFVGKVRRAGIPTLAAASVLSLGIPLPPLPVQEEIVRILDTFTDLEAELEAELEARTTQYEETRNRLMAFDAVEGHPLSGLIRKLCPEGVPSERLGQIAEIGTGSSDKKEATESGQFPFFVRSRTVMSKDDFEFDEEAIVIPGEGGIGEIFHHVVGKYALHQRAYRIHFISDAVLPRFAYFYFVANFKAHITSRAVDATVSSIRKPMIEAFPIPLPPIPVQEQIVRILDSFDSLVTDISVGLPAEIAARRKQYEYYRDKLLSFERLAA